MRSVGVLAHKTPPDAKAGQIGPFPADGLYRRESRSGIWVWHKATEPTGVQHDRHGADGTPFKRTFRLDFAVQLIWNLHCCFHGRKDSRTARQPQCRIAVFMHIAAIPLPAPFASQATRPGGTRGNTLHAKGPGAPIMPNPRPSRKEGRPCHGFSTRPWFPQKDRDKGGIARRALSPSARPARRALYPRRPRRVASNSGSAGGSRSRATGTSLASRPADNCAKRNLKPRSGDSTT